MQLTIFFVEVIIIFFYMTWDDPDSFFNNSKDEYYTYYSKDIIGNDILKFPQNTSEEEKLNTLKASELIQEIAKYSLNIEIMSEIFNNGIEDNTPFKKDFISYLESIHFEYIGGNITNEELKNLILHPKNIHDI
jgi:hypothetical protein